jgi:hypothetical protein
VIARGFAKVKREREAAEQPTARLAGRILNAARQLAKKGPSHAGN